jgi:hypothetical protein
MYAWEDMSDRPEDIPSLRELAARLRSLATAELSISSQLRRMADETDDWADGLASRLRP